MPSRKKERRKQHRSRRNQLEVKLAGRGSPRNIIGLKAAGCRIEKRRDGAIAISHPDPDFNPNADPSKLLDRSQLNDACRRIIAQNYVHNYAQALRKGEDHGTSVIAKNLLDTHLMPTLCEELEREDIHVAMLLLLSQCGKDLPEVLSHTDFDAETPSMWMSILRLIVQYGRCSEDTQLTLARCIKQLVVCMIDAKRELFRSKEIWHTSLPYFFALVSTFIMVLPSEGFWIIVAYEGLIPFVAQASSWDQCRQDIVAESRMLQIRKCFSIENACDAAQRLISLVVKGYDDFKEDAPGARGGEASMSPLELIASTPLLSDDTNCAASSIVGMIRMMKSGQKDSNHLSTAVKTLLFDGYVDSCVIAELIEYGRSLSSLKTICSLSLILGILGLDNVEVDDKRIRKSDSRFAAAVRHGLVEMCIRVLVPSDNYSAWTIVSDIVKGLYSMALHKKTMRALREKKSDILEEMETICKNPAYQFDRIICPVINDCLELGAPTCCNCLKEFDRKDLRFCECCNIECYCSRACQTQSWNAGHNFICMKNVSHSEQSREHSKKSEMKKLEVLKNKLIMSGCRFVKHNIEKIAGLEVEESVIVDFRKYPPSIKFERSGTFLWPSSLKCTFVCSYHGASMISVDKAIPFQALASKNPRIWWRVP